MTSLWLAGTEEPTDDPWAPGLGVQDAVIGAGLTGLVTAVLLARAGRRVAVIEARYPGAVATGNTTAKLSLLQGSHLSVLRRYHSAETARAYVAANKAGQEWLLQYCTTRDVAVQRRPAYSYATTPGGAGTLRRELDHSREAGLATEWVDDLMLPFETLGGVRLADQAQFDPVEVLAALRTELRTLGGRLHHGIRVTGVRARRPCLVQTEAGNIRAERVVLATGIPILDRGLYFALMEPQRSYSISFRGVSDPPTGMYLSVDQPTRSLRTAPRPDGTEQLLVGGNGHGVGRIRSELEQLEDLREWSHRHFPGAQETHWWSAQDYAPVDAMPVVGAVPGTGGRVFAATGYAKWGMTNAAGAALWLAARLLRDEVPAWAETLERRAPGPAVVARAGMVNGKVGVHATTGWLRAGARSRRTPAEGAGLVARSAAGPVGVSTVDGVTCAVSAVCPHLGGVVTWNDAEKSWDCPLHGSRFAPDGSVLEGPATSPLKSRS